MAARLTWRQVLAGGEAARRRPRWPLPIRAAAPARRWQDLLRQPRARAA